MLLLDFNLALTIRYMLPTVIWIQLLIPSRSIQCDSVHPQFPCERFDKRLNPQV
jgi:hypothetical protein